MGAGAGSGGACELLAVREPHALTNTRAHAHASISAATWAGGPVVRRAGGPASGRTEGPVQTSCQSPACSAVHCARSGKPSCWPWPEGARSVDRWA